MKAWLVTLSDGREVTVREPGVQEMSLWMGSLNVVRKLVGEWNDTLSSPNVIMPREQPTQEEMDKLLSLLAAVTGLTLDELKGLGLNDLWAIFLAYAEVAPGNFTKRMRSSSNGTNGSSPKSSRTGRKR